MHKRENEYQGLTKRQVVERLGPSMGAAVSLLLSRLERWSSADGGKVTNWQEEVNLLLQR